MLILYTHFQTYRCQIQVSLKVYFCSPYRLFRYELFLSQLSKGLKFFLRTKSLVYKEILNHRIFIFTPKSVLEHFDVW